MLTLQTREELLYELAYIGISTCASLKRCLQKGVIDRKEFKPRVLAEVEKIFPTALAAESKTAPPDPGLSAHLFCICAELIFCENSLEKLGNKIKRLDRATRLISHSKTPRTMHLWTRKRLQELYFFFAKLQAEGDYVYYEKIMKGSDDDD